MREPDGWQRVAALADLADDAAFAVKLGNRRIALYRLDGKVHALDDVCTHALALLSQGFIEGGAVECPRERGFHRHRCFPLPPAVSG